MDRELKWNRALQLLEEKGHACRVSCGGARVIVDDKEYTLEGVARLAEDLYPDEWRAVERRHFEEVRNRKT